MPNFVNDNTTLPFPKETLRTSDVSSNKKLTAADWNALCQAAYDLRSALQTGNVADDSITLAKLADIATAHILGRATAETGDPEALTGTQVTALLDTFTAIAKGLVPAPGGSPTGSRALLDDGSWGAIVTGYVTPEQYGAVGDGTTDDHAAFTSAVSAAKALNGLAALKLTAGKSYKISEAVAIEDCKGFQVWGNNAVVLFPSDDVTITASDAEHSAPQRRSAFFLRNASDCTFRDLRCVGTGNNVVVAGGSGSAFALRRATRTLIQNCQHTGGGSLYVQDPVGGAVGNGTSLTVAGGIVTLTAASGTFHQGMKQLFVTIAGSSNRVNDGAFLIASVASNGSSITFANTGGVTETSSFRWSVSDGDRTTKLIGCTSQDPHGICTAAAYDTEFLDCSWDYDLSHIDTCGIGDSFTLSGTTVTLTDAYGRFKSSHHGKYVTIASATSGGNNGTFGPITFVSATQISFTNASGVTELFSGTWWLMNGEKAGRGAGVGGLAVAGGVVTLTADVASFQASDVGKIIRITGATTSANRVHAAIDTFVSSTQVTFQNAGGVSETYSGVWTIDGWDNGLNAAGDTNGSSHAVYIFAGRSNVKFRGCTFRGNRTTAIKVSGSSLPITDVSVSGCTFIECATVIIFGADDSQDHSGLSFTHNILVDCATQRRGFDQGSAVAILGSRSTLIAFNQFRYTRDAINSLDGNGIGGNNGIAASRYVTGVSEPVQDITIAYNKFTADPAGTRVATASSKLTTAIALTDVGHIAKWRTGGSLTKVGSIMTLSDSSAKFNSRDVGKSITFVNSTSGANDGTFTIETVPSTTTLTFTNASGVAGSIGGTYRIPPRSPLATSVVVAHNEFNDVATVPIFSTNSVGLEIFGNITSGATNLATCSGDVAPRIYGNREIGRNTQNATILLNQGTSWPIVYDNTITNNALGTSSARGIGIGVGNTTPVDYPLLGKSGRLKPTQAKQQVVVAYGARHVDGDTITVGGTTFTYKATSPTGNQFNSFAGLVTLIDAVAGVGCQDYGSQFSTPVTTQHLLITYDVAHTVDGILIVTVSALNPTALVLLRNSTGANLQCIGRGSASTSATAPNRSVVWSPLACEVGTIMLAADNDAARTLLGDGSAATGTITCVAKASLADTDYVTISDGLRAPALYEFDVTGDGVTAGRVQVNVSAATTAADVAALLKTAIEANQPVLTVTDAGSGVLTLSHKLYGTIGNVTIAESVANAGFTVSGFVNGSGGGYQHVKVGNNSGCCDILQHATSGGTEEMRWTQ